MHTTGVPPGGRQGLQCGGSIYTWSRCWSDKADAAPGVAAMVSAPSRADSSRNCTCNGHNRTKTINHTPADSPIDVMYFDRATSKGAQRMRVF